jgi:sporulation-control protein
MMSQYIQRINLGTPKVSLKISKDKVYPGESINGVINLDTGLLKVKIKRYDVELIGLDSSGVTNQVFNERTVFCALDCLLREKKSLSFSLRINEELPIHLTYKIRSRVELDNVQRLIDELPLTILFR